MNEGLKGLERHEVKQLMTDFFIFGCTIPLREIN